MPREKGTRRGGGLGDGGPAGAGMGRLKVEMAGGAGRVGAEVCGTGPPVLPKRKENDWKRRALSHSHL